MKVIKVALENRRYDLLAHALVFSALKVLRNGGSPHVPKKSPELLRQRSR